MKIIGYMCKVDFECELGQSNAGVDFYESIEELTENRSCVKHCGIVKVSIELLEVVQEPS